MKTQKSKILIIKEIGVLKMENGVVYIKMRKKMLILVNILLIEISTSIMIMMTWYIKIITSISIT